MSSSALQCRRDARTDLNSKAMRSAMVSSKSEGTKLNRRRQQDLLDSFATHLKVSRIGHGGHVLGSGTATTSALVDSEANRPKSRAQRRNIAKAAKRQRRDDSIHVEQSQREQDELQRPAHTEAAPRSKNPDDSDYHSYSSDSDDSVGLSLFSSPTPALNVSLKTVRDALDAFLAEHPLFATTDIRAHRGQWYRGPPSDNNILTDYSEDGDTFLPKPNPKADGFLQAYLRPLSGPALDWKIDLDIMHPTIAAALKGANIWHTRRGWTTSGPGGPTLDLSHYVSSDLVLPSLPDAGAYVGPLYPPRLPRGGHINSSAATLFLEQPHAADGIASDDEGLLHDDYWESDEGGHDDE